MTLAEFVAARLDERWAQAQRDVGYHAAWAARADQPVRDRAWHVVDMAESIARTIEAQRRTLARHADCGSGVGYCDDGGHAWDFPDPPGCPDLADLAAPDHDHPDFNPVWKIEETP